MTADVWAVLCFSHQLMLELTGRPVRQPAGAHAHVLQPRPPAPDHPGPCRAGDVL